MRRKNSESDFGDILRSGNDEQHVSRWWLAGLGLVLLYGFAAFLAITWPAYADKPPIPARVVDDSGREPFTGAGIRRGQQIFLDRGLMGNGTVWGHGSYPGPDFPALVLLCIEASRFVRATGNPLSGSMAAKFRWPLRFIMAVGFWNFFGAGVLGFLINMPIVSYFEVGNYLTPNHGHASMFGVFGMLALALLAWRFARPTATSPGSQLKNTLPFLSGASI